jgi:hypothetical protein
VELGLGGRGGEREESGRREREKNDAERGERKGGRERKREREREKVFRVLPDKILQGYEKG